MPLWDSVITTIFPLRLHNWSLWLSKFHFMFLLCFRYYKYPYCQTALFSKITSRSFFLALSTLFISGILLAKVLCCICLQGIIKATAHYDLSVYGARKSHVKKCGVCCVHICRYMHTFTHTKCVRSCKNNICWILSP